MANALLCGANSSWHREASTCTRALHSHDPFTPTKRPLGHAMFAQNSYGCLYPPNTPTQEANCPGQSFSLPEQDFRLEPNIEVTIKEIDRWEQFYQIGNEMIVARKGRLVEIWIGTLSEAATDSVIYSPLVLALNPFPAFDFDVSGLERNTEYRFAIAFERCDDKRYTHQDGVWKGHGRGEPLGAATLLGHHREAQSGRQWMREGVRFHKLRFTNNAQTTSTTDASNTIHLLSMHKYRPVVYVWRVEPHPLHPEHLVARITFTVMEFIAVTAYQSGKLKDLKVAFNPFAKAFRKDGKHTAKRKSDKMSDVDEAELPKKCRAPDEYELPEQLSYAAQAPPQAIPQATGYQPNPACQYPSIEPTTSNYYWQPQTYQNYNYFNYTASQAQNSNYGYGTGEGYNQQVPYMGQQTPYMNHQAAYPQ
uniref:T-box domain-containing protein n=1 Tax=Steinernema glaseri TaxID=37863 RepID=A0A1I8AB36_9BILA